MYIFYNMLILRLENATIKYTFEFEHVLFIYNFNNLNTSKHLVVKQEHG